MAKSLAKLKEQIAKLQKEADAIQSTVIARIRREIAQHGLTTEHLFGSTAGASSTDSVKAAPKGKAAKSSAANKPAKYADEQGNSWHGIGKRPDWIHTALSEGRALEEFLVGTKKVAPTSKKSSAAVKSVPKAAKKVAPTKRATPVKKAAKAAATEESAVKAPAKKAPKAKKVSSGVKSTKAPGAAKPASKTGAKKATPVAAVKKAPAKAAKVTADPAPTPAEP